MTNSKVCEYFLKKKTKAIGKKIRELEAQEQMNMCFCYCLRKMVVRRRRRIM
jgi:uncharacterized protein YbaP (TraB family)